MSRAAPRRTILLVTLRYPPHVVGGYEQLAEELAQGLRGRGHRVVVLCGRSATLAGRDDLRPWLEPAIDGDPDLFALSHRGSNADRWRLHFHRRANGRATARAIAEVRPDVLLYTNLGLVSLAPLLAARRAGLPRLGVVCDRWPANHWLEDWRAAGRKRGRAALLALLWRLWRGWVGLGQVWTPSEALRQSLLADGLDPERTAVLQLPLRPELEPRLFAAPLPRRAAGEALRVVCTAAQWEGKGQHVLLEAAARAVQRGADLRLDFAGGGDPTYRARLGRLAAVPALAGRVHFHGQLDSDRLLGLLGASHVFAFPSLWFEPAARATMEAMAGGLALVASDAGGTPEQFVSGVSGVLVPAGDIEALAAALAGLERDESGRRQLAAAGREHAAREFRAVRFLDLVERGLEQALERGAER